MELKASFKDGFKDGFKDDFKRLKAAFDICASSEAMPRSSHGSNQKRPFSRAPVAPQTSVPPPPNLRPARPLPGPKEVSGTEAAVAAGNTSCACEINMLVPKMSGFCLKSPLNHTPKGGTHTYIPTSGSCIRVQHVLPICISAVFTSVFHPS